MTYERAVRVLATKTRLNDPVDVLRELEDGDAIVSSARAQAAHPLCPLVLAHAGGRAAGRPRCRARTCAPSLTAGPAGRPRRRSHAPRGDLTSRFARWRRPSPGSGSPRRATSNQRRARTAANGLPRPPRLATPSNRNATGMRSSSRLHDPLRRSAGGQAGQPGCGVRVGLRLAELVATNCGGCASSPKRSPGSSARSPSSSPSSHRSSSASRGSGR
jgi:hypothetical protein